MRIVHSFSKYKDHTDIIVADIESFDFSSRR